MNRNRCPQVVSRKLFTVLRIQHEKKLARVELGAVMSLVSMRKGHQSHQQTCEPRDACELCHTGSMTESTGASEDVKQRMKEALEAKKKASQKNVPHGSAPSQGKVHDHSDRAGGKREHRRKSG